MNVESFTLDTPHVDGYADGFKMAAKRYTSIEHGASGGFTILACHGLGQRESSLPHAFADTQSDHATTLDKEQWEPILEQLFSLQSKQLFRLRIREAWAFDWQNHGESAVINEDIIKDNPEAVCKSYNLCPRDVPT